MLILMMHGLAQAGTWVEGFYEETVVGGFSAPIAFAFTPEGQAIVGGKAGQLWWAEDGTALEIADLSEEINGQGDRGLIGMAVDPAWDSLGGGWLYLLYTVDPLPGEPDEAADVPTWGRLSRYWLEPDGSLDPLSQEVLLGELPEQGFPLCSVTHSVGSLAFGPDGALYASAGEGAHFDYYADYGQNLSELDPQCEGLLGDWQDIGAFRAQSLHSLGGKLLRIDPDTGLGLPDNPHWTGLASDNASRVWASGLRNPWRFTIHPDRGSIWAGDVGEARWEELNVALGGENFGWPCYEGIQENPQYFAAAPTTAGCETIGGAANPGALTEPALAWHHSTASLLSPAGVSDEDFTGATALAGPFYQGATYPAAYVDRLFIADFTEGWLRSAEVERHDHGGLPEEHLLAVHALATDMPGLVDMAAHPLTGELHLLNVYSGALLRVGHDSADRPPTASFTASTTGGPLPLRVSFNGSASADPEGGALSYLWSFGDGTSSTRVSPTKTWRRAGVYTVTLAVTDSAGQSASASTQILAGRYRPTATITSPIEASTFSLPRTFTLSGVGTDVDSTAGQLTCSWSIWLGHAEHEHPDWRTASGCSASLPISAIDVDGYLRIRLQVSDRHGLSAEDEVVVWPANQPPTLVDPGIQRLVAGETLALPILWTDPEGDAVNPTVLEQPAGSSFDAATGWFTWTPTAADVGAHRLRLYAEDDSRAPRSATSEVSIEVLPSDLGLVAISVFQDWGVGYCADLSWTNNTGLDLEGWTLRLGLDPTTSPFATWNGQFTAESGGYSIEPMDYNRVILAGETLVVGLCADGPAPLWAEIIGPETTGPNVMLLYTEWGNWGGSACGDVHIINQDTELIDGWMVSWGLPSGTTLGSSWRAQVSFSGDRYVALDDGWNAQIAPDAEQIFGFCTLGAGSPEAFAFALR